MSRLGGFSGMQVARVAEALGYEKARMRGDHMVYTRPGALLHLSIPDHRSLSPGTLRKLIRAMGLTVDQFLALAKK